MAQRQPLREIQPNRRDRRTLTPNKRAEIVGAVNCGVSYAKISREHDIDRSVVRKLYKRTLNININYNSLRASRYLKYSSREQTQVLAFT